MMSHVQCCKTVQRDIYLARVVCIQAKDESSQNETLMAMCQGKTRKRKKNSLFTSIERNYQNIYALMLHSREKLERLEIDIVLLHQKIVLKT